MKDGRTVWLPWHRSRLPGLPDGLSYRCWDGSGPLPGDPADVRFLVAPPIPDPARLLRPVLPRMRHLEVLQLLGSGDLRPTPLLADLPAGTRLADGRGADRRTTAELAVALLLALCRGLDRCTGAGPGPRLSLVGGRVLVVGYGAVGASVAALLGALRCEPVLVARTARTTPAGRLHGAEELPALLPTADAVVLCAPLTDQPHTLLGADALARLKDGALLVDVAGEGLLDTGALLREVRAGRLRAGLDVPDPAPLPHGHPLTGLVNAVVTPRTATFTDVPPAATADFLRHQLHRYQRGAEPHNVVLTTPAATRGERPGGERPGGERAA
ncbi:NAD(P)-dependent oxidoreductase [Streptomyces sp. NPDC003247]|uniref:NAD(P)-dependent oxidoreductase n=1 Tax=Streptomyces sp. NPDC003247 TaxID=3364677 RepID=UPI003699F1E7